jgi:hypothetical protein
MHAPRCSAAGEQLLTCSCCAGLPGTDSGLQARAQRLGEQLGWTGGEKHTNRAIVATGGAQDGYFCPANPGTARAGWSRQNACWLCVCWDMHATHGEAGSQAFAPAIAACSPVQKGCQHAPAQSKTINAICGT